jgi:hypothetical protein
MSRIRIQTAFVLRSLFVAALLGSLVACTFEGAPGSEPQGETTSRSEKGRATDGGSAGNDSGVPVRDGGSHDDSDAAVWVDAGPWGGNDASVDESSDAGVWDNGADASADEGSDAGVWNDGADASAFGR